jgi:stalled ribosome rescue protein Dom34
MNEDHYTLVWIDHQQAKIFQFDAGEVQRSIIYSTHPHEHLHHHANAGDSGHVSVDHSFLERVAQALMTRAAVLITGPGTAKRELMRHIERQHPGLAAAVSGVQTLDHPSDGELQARARGFFTGEERARA